MVGILYSYTTTSYRGYLHIANFSSDTMKRSEFVREYLDGKSVIDIAKKYGVTREAVYLYLRRLPDWEKIYKSKRRTKWQRAVDKYSEKIPKIIKLRKKGYSTIQVSRKLEVPFEAVREILKTTAYDNSKQARDDRNERIYNEYMRGTPQKKLALKYNMAQSSISDIVRKWHLKTM